jgi:serine/threonine protein kinase
MNDELTPDRSIPLPLKRRIDGICDDFEMAWKRGETPALESFADRVEPAERPRLLRELIPIEVHYRRSRGEPIATELILADHPDLRDELQAVLDPVRETDERDRHFQLTSTRSAAGANGQAAKLRLRCPDCHNAIELVPDTPLEEIHCPSCGSTFSLLSGCVDTRDASEPRRLGQFELVERVGTGSFGTVWKARDTVLDRMVAIKIPRKAQLSVDEAEKFIREARSAAQLRHPNIVSVHEVGRGDGSIYIVSDFVHGVPLSEVLADRRLGKPEAVNLAIKIADALHHAHEAGVIHRDLKPSNIMIDDAGEPHLMDFGLAKREAAEATLTLDGVVLGTPAYMSPEQARGEGRDVDRRTDIYSLGTVLFQLLTGELPFRGTARMLLHKVINDEAPSPRSIDASVPKDLETICLKCLQKEPAGRYANAKEIAIDLNRFLRHEPINASAVGRREKLWRWCKRRPAVAAFTGTLLLLLVVFAAAASVPAVHDAQKEYEVTRPKVQLFVLQAHRSEIPSPTSIAEDDWLQARFTNGTPRHAVSVKLEYNGKIVSIQSGTIGADRTASIDILVPNPLLPEDWTPVAPGRLDVIMAHGGQVTRQTLQLGEGPRLLIKSLEVHEGSYMYFAIRGVPANEDVNVTLRYDSESGVREQTWNIGRTDGSNRLDEANSKLLAPKWITSIANEDGIDVSIDVGDVHRRYKVCLKKAEPARTISPG